MDRHYAVTRDPRSAGLVAMITLAGVPTLVDVRRAINRDTHPSATVVAGRIQLKHRIARDVAVITVTGDITLNKGDVLPKKGEQPPAAGTEEHPDQPGRGVVCGFSRTWRAGSGVRHDEKPGRRPEAREQCQRLNELLVAARLVTGVRTFDNEAKTLASFASSSE
jgi:hypothetical protein